MKRSSKVLVVLGIFAALVAGTLFYLLSNLDRIVAAAIEKYGSGATGTDVEVASVRIRLKEGEGSIRGLRIGNPRGFSTPDALSLGDITIALDAGSVARHPVVIDRIVATAPRITYEINEAGLANIGEIRRNLEAYRGAGPSGKEQAGGNAHGRGTLRIRRLIVEGGEMTIRIAARPGEPFHATLPGIALTNLGGKGGSSPREIAIQVLSPIVAQAALAAARAGVGRYLGEGADEAKKALEEKAREKLGAPGEEATKAGEEAVRKLLGK